jgi:hypothetical protein
VSNEENPDISDENYMPDMPMKRPRREDAPNATEFFKKSLSEDLGGKFVECLVGNVIAVKDKSQCIDPSQDEISLDPLRDGATIALRPFNRQGKGRCYNYETLAEYFNQSRVVFNAPSGTWRIKEITRSGNGFIHPYTREIIPCDEMDEAVSHVIKRLSTVAKDYSKSLAELYNLLLLFINNVRGLLTVGVDIDMLKNLDDIHQEFRDLNRGLEKEYYTLELKETMKASDVWSELKKVCISIEEEYAKAAKLFNLVLVDPAEAKYLGLTGNVDDHLKKSVLAQIQENVFQHSVRFTAEEFFYDLRYYLGFLRENPPDQINLIRLVENIIV